MDSTQGEAWTKAQYLQSSGSASGYDGEFETGSKFEKPYGFMADCPDTKRSFHHKELGRAFEEVKAQVLEKEAKAVEFFGGPKNAGKTHVTSKIANCSLKLTDPNDADRAPFNEVQRMPPFITVQKVWAFLSGKPEGAPSWGLAQFLIVTSGTFWFTFLEVGDIIDAGYDIENLGDLLAACSEEFLSKKPSMILGEGDSAYCPLGSISVAIALGPEKLTDDKETRVASFISYPVLDTLQTSRVSPVVLGDIKAWINKGIARKLKVLKYEGDNEHGIQTYLKGWAVEDQAPKPDKDDLCEFG